jgi:hypothetical protein
VSSGIGVKFYDESIHAEALPSAASRSGAEKTIPPPAKREFVLENGDCCQNLTAKLQRKKKETSY